MAVVQLMEAEFNANRMDGYCVAHGGEARCKQDGCVKLARPGGYCVAHGSRPHYK